MQPCLTPRTIGVSFDYRLTHHISFSTEIHATTKNSTSQVWVEDDETFAADPYVALPWGMNGLSLPHIISLARALRRGLAGQDEAVGTTLVPVSDFSSTVRAWALSEGIENNGGGEKQDIPRAWTVPSSGYIDTLSRAIAGGASTDTVSWRR